MAPSCDVTQLAVAEKGAPGVLADTMEADVGVQVTSTSVGGDEEATGEVWHSSMPTCPATWVPASRFFLPIFKDRELP